MIPLDHHFNDLLNETIPFPLPTAEEAITPKVVPTRATAEAVVPKAPAVSTQPAAPAVPEYKEFESKEPASQEPEFSDLDEASPIASIPFPGNTLDYSNNTFDCLCDSNDCQITEPATAADSVAPPVESAPTPPPLPEPRPELLTDHIKSVSKVEISADRAVPFEIDPGMVINRPRLTLKESGLPIALNPAEPDPSIVGESVLGFKSAPKAKSSSQEVFSEGQEIQSEVSSEILDLLEKQSGLSEQPSLKAFDGDDAVAETSDDASTVRYSREEVLDALLYNHSSEIKEEPNRPTLAENRDSIDQALLAEKARLAEAAESTEAYELADDVTEEDLEAYETDEAATSIEAPSDESIDTTDETSEVTEVTEVTETTETTEVAEVAEEAPAVAETTDETFFPMLQVDRYVWPRFCTEMHPIIKIQLNRLGEKLIAKAANSDQKVIAVAGSGVGAGSSSILLGLATSLEAAGQKVAIIDANIKSPTLASSLGLQPEQGWETILSGELPVEESLIDSIEDRIALLPLCLQESQKITFGVRTTENERMNEAVQTLRKHYDFVLVDLGSPEAADIAAFANMSEWIDSSVVVHNLRDSSRARLIQTRNMMRDYGVSVAGIAENFAPRESCFDDDNSYRAA